MDGLEMNVDLTPEMQRKTSVQAKPASKDVKTVTASNREKSKKGHPPEKQPSRKIIDKIDSNF